MSRNPKLPLYDQAIAAPLPRRENGHRGDSIAPYRLTVYAACAALAVLCNYVLGKDMAWDTLNYHLYAGFSAVNDRFAQDYFAAGVPAYFNPYAYVPFYLMVTAGLPALLIGSIFAALHSAILWMTFELSVSVCPFSEVRPRLLCGICGIALAIMNPVLMQQIGSCFADITTAELALGGWVLLTAAVRTPSIVKVVLAALLLGTASALKLSNAIAAASAIALIFWLPLVWRDRIRFGVVYGLGVGIAFIIVSAPWSYRLERTFGNPLFPIFNNVFRSPDYSSEVMHHDRFVPGSLLEGLWRPFAMLDPVRMVHEELRAPDLRYATLAVLVVALLIHWLWQRRTQIFTASNSRGLTDSQRTLASLGAGFLVDWIAWLYVSGNSRYFLPMACIAAALVVGLTFQIFASRPKVRNYILAAVLGVQATQLYMGSEYRWNGTPWGGQWFDLTIPDRFVREPNLYLTMGAQSNSFLAPFFSKQSAFVNFSGGYALNPEGANGDRIKTLITQYSPHVRVLLPGKRLYEGNERRAPRRSEVDDALLSFGLRADIGDCETITVHGLPPDLQIQIKTTAPSEPQSRDTTYLVSCLAVTDTRDRSADIARAQEVNVVLNRLEDACPELFQPRRPITVHDGIAWRRLYANTDLTAWVSHGSVKFNNPVRGADGLNFVGRESDWAKGPLRLNCGRRNGAYYAHIVDSKE